jgi:lysophospholipase L1-like esterase
MKLLYGVLFVFALHAAETLEDRVEAQRRMLHDFGGLIRYGSVNTEIPAPKVGESRVVFLGDDHTENWDTSFFREKPSYFNRGIVGQTSGQMLLRFRQDVISLKPKVVVIQAGSNDLAGLAGPATTPMIAENIMSMVELAKVNGIKVVLAAIPPVCDCVPGAPRQTIRRTPGKIIGVNGWLKDYATESGSVYADVFRVLGGRNLKPEFTADGFSLNEAAYRIMTPVLEEAIATALAGK